MLVGIGACLFTLLMIQLIDRFDSDDIRADPIRVVEAITSGIAFLAGPDASYMTGSEMVIDGGWTAQ